MNDNDCDTLPVVRAAQLEDVTPQRRWLVDTLWARAAVGIIGGAPKLGKSWLGLDLALSVASATPCLDTFHIHQPGPALLYMAEDADANIKDRLRGLCRHRRIDLEDIPVYLITAPTLRLDRDDDQQRLHNTVARMHPRLLLLDPFVRLHNINENDAGEVSAILAYLRQLQRAFNLAVIVVHHSRKNGRPGGAGANLRGSNDFHAWSDSSLYLHYQNNKLILTPEHRAAPAPQAMPIRLNDDQDADQTHFEIVDHNDADLYPPAAANLEDNIIAALQKQPRTRDQLRAALRVRNQSLGNALQRLQHHGLVARHNNRWALPIPVPTQHPERNANNRTTTQLKLHLQSA